jgi:hypothetical protein
VYVLLLQAINHVERGLTLDSNFLQVAAGGKLIADKKTLRQFAPYPGVYKVWIRPPGAWEEDWTAWYHGKSDETVGKRTADYLDVQDNIFSSDKNSLCKYQLFQDLAAKGFDVAIQ